MVALSEAGETLAIVGVLIALLASGITTAVIMPSLIRKMSERGIVGRDWNKRGKDEIPKLGGIVVLFTFPIGISIATGVIKIFGSFGAGAILAAIGVLFIGGMIGIIDDISDIPRRIKALLLAFAALPLILAGIGKLAIDLPFGIILDFSTSYNLLLVYWVLVVPIAVSGASNAMNMSAGYNGLESGQISVISLALLVSAFLSDAPLECALIFAALFGASIGLNYFNRYPAVIFVGNVGTLSMGAVVGAGVIIGGIQFQGLIAIIPAFFELFSTAYYSFVRKVDRRAACQNPIIDEKRRLHAPKGAERYTLAFWLLSKRPMTEEHLVTTILGIYAAFGVLAVLFSIL